MSGSKPTPRQTSSASTWFERNPKKTLAALFFLVLIALAVLFEVVSSFKGGTRKMEFTRYIRLRECEPNYRAHFVPKDDFLRVSDTLVRKEYSLKIDKHGFIMPSLVHPDPDLVMVFLGGSTTMCLYVEEEHRFPYLTGRLLEKQTNVKIDSINAARGGNNSFHSHNILLNKALPFKPRIAVLLNNVNDLTTLLYGTYWDLHTDRSQIVEVYPEIVSFKKLFTEFCFPHLYRSLKSLERGFRRKVLYKLRGKRNRSEDDEFRHVRGKIIKINRPELRRKFAMSVNTFVGICRAWGITPVLLTQANRLKETPDPNIQQQAGALEEQGITYAAYKEAYEAFNQVIREVGKENKVLVIDLAREVPQEREYMYDMVHFNDRGSQYASRIIAEHLAPLVNANKAREKPK
jgi:hypothetical protein